MIKRLLSTILISALLLSGCILTAFADETPCDHIVSSYEGNVIYSFFSGKGNGLTEMNVYFEDEKDYVTDASSPKPVLQTDSTIHYLFLIDASDSMPWFSNYVNSFCEETLDREQLPVKISVATLGKDFSVLADSITDTSEAMEVIESISYTQPVSQICDGLLDAIDYFKSIPSNGKEIRSIVLMTDGDTYMSETGRSEEAIQRVASATEEAVQHYSETIVNSVCFQRWNETTFQAVSQGSGQHYTAFSPDEAAACGEELPAFFDNLYRVDIKYIKSRLYARFNGQYYFTVPGTVGSAEISVENIRNYDLTDSESVPLFDEEGNPVSRTSDESQNETDETDSSPTAENIASELSTDVSVSASNDQIDSIAKNDKAIPLWLIIIAAIIIIVIMIIIILLIKRSRKRNQQAVNRKVRDQSSSFILLSVELIDGRMSVASKELKLYDELKIGSNAACDLIIDDPYVASVNARIFIENGIIYLEDVIEPHITYLNGMRIFQPNRLRSGDKIMISNTVFRLKF